MSHTLDTSVPLLADSHLTVLGWLSGCSSIHKCESCRAEMECQGLWDAASAHDNSHIKAHMGYYAERWARVQARREGGYSSPATASASTSLTNSRR